MSGHEKYIKDLQATLKHVRAWKRANPGKEPKLPDPNGVAVLAPLLTAMQYMELNRDAKTLAKHVAANVPDATWMMFYGTWNHVYNESEAN